MAFKIPSSFRLTFFKTFNKFTAIFPQISRNSLPSEKPPAMRNQSNWRHLTNSGQVVHTTGVGNFKPGLCFYMMPNFKSL